MPRGKPPLARVPPRVREGAPSHPQRRVVGTRGSERSTASSPLDGGASTFLWRVRTGEGTGGGAATLLRLPPGAAIAEKEGKGMKWSRVLRRAGRLPVLIKRK
jgi:hypothetical protein